MQIINSLLSLPSRGSVFSRLSSRLDESYAEPPGEVGLGQLSWHTTLEAATNATSGC